MRCVVIFFAIPQAACLGPISFGERIVLVGDHYQLPPLVMDTEARAKGMQTSLFMRLSTAHPQVRLFSLLSPGIVVTHSPAIVLTLSHVVHVVKAIVQLEQQYRMNEDIMALSNTLVYNHKLQCGSETVRRQSLLLPHLAHFSPTNLLEDALLPLVSPHASVVFIDTDQVCQTMVYVRTRLCLDVVSGCFCT
jgi:DNA replication ATP-dependent helicase Dna2